MKRLGTTTRLRRNGYTLIEMLIAVSLVAVLMTVVWGLMSMYTTLQTVGSEVTAEQQLVRSVMQLIQDDLTRLPLSSPEHQEATTDPFAAFDPVIPPGVSSGDSTSEPNTVFEIADLIRNGNGGPANVAIQGTRDSIRITVPQPSNRKPPEVADEGFVELAESTLPKDGVAPSVEEFQSITYQLQGFEESELTALPMGLYRTQTDAARLKTVLSRQTNPDGESVLPGLRLTKQVIEQLLFPPEDDLQTTGAEIESQPTCDLIPDVAGLEFRYYDGKNWQRNWSSSSANLLPVAIEVTVDVITAQQLLDLEALSQTKEQPDRLERYLKQAFTSPEQRRQPSEDPLLEGMTVTPHRYTSIILLDTTKKVRSQTESLNLGEFDL